MTEPSSGVSGCVYNCPVPLNNHYSETRGLERWEAYERIRQNVQASLDCAVDTMPVDLFLDNFLPTIPLDRKKEVLSSRGAFNAVPFSASTPQDIYEPLVRAPKFPVL